MVEQIQIVVVDDHPVLRDGLSAVLSTQPDFRVIGEAESGVEAVEIIVELRPDVVMLDLEMPEMDGVETLKRLREHNPDIRVIVFTAFDTDERILAAVQAGAQGYLLKGAPRDQIFEAVRVVHSGDSLLQPVVASKLLRQMSQTSESTETFGSVTPTGLDVLRLLARGLQNKEIAEELGITERTVKFHVGTILNPPGMGSRYNRYRASPDFTSIQVEVFTSWTDCLPDFMIPWPAIWRCYMPWPVRRW